MEIGNVDMRRGEKELSMPNTKETSGTYAAAPAPQFLNDRLAPEPRTAITESPSARRGLASSHLLGDFRGNTEQTSRDTQRRQATGFPDSMSFEERGLLVRQLEQQVQTQKIWVSVLRGEMDSRIRSKQESLYRLTLGRQMEFSNASGLRDPLALSMPHGDYRGLLNTGYPQGDDMSTLASAATLRSFDHLRTMDIAPMKREGEGGKGDSLVLSRQAKFQRSFAPNKRRKQEELSWDNEKPKARADVVAKVPQVPPSLVLPPGEGIPLALPSDESILSPYQVLIRQSIELFEAQPDAQYSNIQGRVMAVVPGQVGLRCKHCASRPLHWRGRGSVYFPGRLAAVYQAAQNMGWNHFLASCEDMDSDLKKKFVAAREQQLKEPRRSGGKGYWEETCRNVGLEEREGHRGVWLSPNRER